MLYFKNIHNLKR